ncbi:uncharacterized protein MELLADRAFT_72322 [Melampsora larici-populina 98AG31]|uniref:Uncharacterized protein n=1 Tax=Melampsora larici-populina (strain 98AG31 / pathotype 3-4-7) TaxID=747676 RepID=F4RSF6_MELLP|nr:uncharacterized protein MELLADRAFT_72322 [Melampsora larici-populina 98AG31]EGG04591.1 hypothetical protein MELLADRAFT_72322 [Melampsora larici-populina 98AG31]
MQGKIEDHQFIMTPRPNQSVTHYMSPIDQAVINSSRPVALSELSQSRNSTRRASDQHGNSFGAPSQSPVVSDAERKKRDKHRRHPQMTYKDARARDQQPPPNSLFEQFKGPSGEPNDPIQLD